jgi:mannitol/fructose-specific phosphotransferase system IIA component (Ntr-type)
MHPVVNHLIQLQELTLIRDEQRVAGGGHHLQQLDASIRSMAVKLPADSRAHYEKLAKRDSIFVAAISESHCSVCGMHLAISFIQAVRLAREVHTCPNCARMLYFPTAPLRRVGEAPRRTAPRKVGIARFSAASLMLPRLGATDKEGVITALATRMSSDGFVGSGATLLEEALRREAILSTAVEHGLAFPHVRGVEGGGLALALGTSQKGVDFGGVSRSKTRIAFFIAIPTAASAFYLKLLAGLTETFMDADNRKAILAEKTPDGLWKALNKVTRSSIK